MLAPIVFHMELKTSVLPVKCTPARSRLESSTSEIVDESPDTKLMTPGGSPASSSSLYTYQADSIADDAGFQTTVLPISAGAVGRLAAMAVKLNGVTA